MKNLQPMLPGYATEPWWGLAAPAGLPPEMAARLNRQINEIVAKPAFRQRFEAMSQTPLSGTSQQLQAMVQASNQEYQRAASRGIIKVE